MDIDQIKAIIAMMKENDLSEFSMEQNGLKIRIKRGPDGFQQVVTTAAAAAPAVVSPSATPPAAAEPAAKAAAETPAEDANLKHIVSPMVGTFYTASAPEAPPFVRDGQEVDEDTVVCIVEAMKVMNEIKSEIKGVITAVLVDNAKPVEFGQKLFTVRPR